MGLIHRHWPSRHLHTLLTLAAVLLCAHSASAQISASIAGNVKDATGAVLPGVTVEASSPALIEKAIAVVTDERGEYKILNLRPGVYTVTATLPGFSTYRREGIELSAGFTATRFGSYGGQLFFTNWGSAGAGEREDAPPVWDGTLYRVGPDRKAHLVASGLSNPSGIAFSGNSIFVADTNRDGPFYKRSWVPDGFIVRIDLR